MGLVRVPQRRYVEAVSEMQTAVTLDGHSTESLAALALAHAAAGSREAAQGVLDTLARARCFARRTEIFRSDAPNRLEFVNGTAVTCFDKPHRFSKR